MTKSIIRFKKISSFDQLKQLRLEIAKPASLSGAWITYDEYQRIWLASEHLCQNSQFRDYSQLSSFLFDFINHFANCRIDPYRNVNIVGKILPKIHSKNYQPKTKEENQIYQMLLAENKLADLVKNHQLRINLLQHFEKPQLTNQADPWTRLNNGCGISVLTMIIYHLKKHQLTINQLAKNIFQFAKKNHLTINGEFFDISNTFTKVLEKYEQAYKIHHCFLKKINHDFTSSYDFFSITWNKSYQKILNTLLDILNKKNIPILAYDVDGRGNPINAGGLRSHFCIIVDYFYLNKKIYFIGKHGWAEQGYHAKADISLYDNQELKGYHVWNEEELISSNLGLNDTNYYQLKSKLASSSKKQSKNHSLHLSHTIIGKKANWSHTGKNILAGKIIEVITKINQPSLFLSHQF